MRVACRHAFHKKRATRGESRRSDIKYRNRPHHNRGKRERSFTAQTSYSIGEGAPEKKTHQTASAVTATYTLTITIRSSIVMPTRWLT